LNNKCASDLCISKFDHILVDREKLTFYQVYNPFLKNQHYLNKYQKHVDDALPDDTITYLGKSRIEKSEQGTCEKCGELAELKIGVWDRLKTMTYSNEMGWRILYLCHKCNQSEKCVNFDNVWGYVGY